MRRITTTVALTAALAAGTVGLSVGPAAAESPRPAPKPVETTKTLTAVYNQAETLASSVQKKATDTQQAVISKI